MNDLPKSPSWLDVEPRPLMADLILLLHHCACCFYGYLLGTRYSYILYTFSLQIVPVEVLIEQIWRLGPGNQGHISAIHVVIKIMTNVIQDRNWEEL